VPSEYLNVDVDLRSAIDPSSLVEALGNRVFILHVGRVGRNHWLRFSLMPQPKHPNQALRRLAALVSGLPRPARRIWNEARKEFDIGIQAGRGASPAEWVLDRDAIQAVGEAGARLRLTIYWPLVANRSAKPSRRSAANDKTLQPTRTTRPGGGGAGSLRWRTLRTGMR
jgi:hypothetical protein